MPARLGTLKSTEPFTTLSEAALDQLRDPAFMHKVPRHAFLTTSGESWPYLKFVGSGGMKAMNESSEGRSLLVISPDPWPGTRCAG